MKKTVFITGSSRGIGAAIVGRLKKEDHYGILNPSREELDLSDFDAIEDFIKKHQDSPIDILINNAGINFPDPIDQLSDENIKKTIQINLTAPIQIARGLVGHMKKNRFGKIVNISSVFGIVARSRQVLYTATKFGLNGATKALALELAPFNILVNSVCPGFTKTDLTKRNSPEKNANLAKGVPLGRFAETEEIAELVEFLISDRNTYITGENILIDGGFTIE